MIKSKCKYHVLPFVLRIVSQPDEECASCINPHLQSFLSAYPVFAQFNKESNLTVPFAQRALLKAPDTYFAAIIALMSLKIIRKWK